MVRRTYAVKISVQSRWISRTGPLLSTGSCNFAWTIATFVYAALSILVLAVAILMLAQVRDIDTSVGRTLTVMPYSNHCLNWWHAALVCAAMLTLASQVYAHSVTGV